MAPALSVLDGAPVIVKKKGYDPLLDDDGDPIPPKDFVEELVKRFGRTVYLLDIDGIERNRPQYSLIKDLSKEAELWVDAGSRTSEGLIDVIIAGAEKAVLSTKRMADIDEMIAAVDVSDKVMLGIDFNKGVISPDSTMARMSPRKVADLARTKGIMEVVFADYSRKRGGPFNRDEIFSLVRSGADIYVGGKVIEDDCPALAELGVKGCLLDMRNIVRRW
jgi:uncharacterized protein related to proFAR isomerase